MPEPDLAPDGRRYRLPWTQEILAAAYRRLLHRPARPPDRPRIVFAIPLIGRAQSPDWENTVARLHDTLASIDRQGHDEHVTVICGQDRPDGVTWGARRHFLQAPPYRPTKLGNDRAVKHKLIVRALRRLCPGFSYVMALDADDILHPDLCAFVARDNNGRGYLIEQGYIVGPAGRVALLAPEPGRYAFWEYCGSCVLVAVDFDRQPWPERLLTRFSHAHHIFGAMARAHGVPPDAVPFPAVLYLFRHGSNASVVHNRISGKQRYLNSFALPAAEARAVLDRFGHRLRPAPKDAAAG